MPTFREDNKFDFTAGVYEKLRDAGYDTINPWPARYTVIDRDMRPVGAVRMIDGKGWFFSTTLPSRRGSRKGAVTAGAALPRWAKNLGWKLV